MTTTIIRFYIYILCVYKDNNNDYIYIYILRERVCICAPTAKFLLKLTTITIIHPGSPRGRVGQ
jgi:hypothetical protein